MREIMVQLPDDVLTRLQSAAARQHVAVTELVQSAIETYLDDEDESDNATILNDITAAMRDALAGRTRPAHAMLDDIKKEFGYDADYRSRP